MEDGFKTDESKHIQYVGRNSEGYEIYYHVGYEEYCLLLPGQAEYRDE